MIFERKSFFAAANCSSITYLRTYIVRTWMASIAFFRSSECSRFIFWPTNEHQLRPHGRAMQAAGGANTTHKSTPTNVAFIPPRCCCCWPMDRKTRESEPKINVANSWVTCGTSSFIYVFVRLCERLKNCTAIEKNWIMYGYFASALSPSYHKSYNIFG